MYLLNANELAYENNITKNMEKSKSTGNLVFWENMQTINPAMNK